MTLLWGILFMSQLQQLLRLMCVLRLPGSTQVCCICDEPPSHCQLLAHNANLVQHD
jgi:hypothetical protein